ncbi:MAG: biotin-dependent carboxyltransferase family protein [Pararhodobacter sp.]|nr:biotin-dependent carboxyltransferase family protein [Pararhodobacter sp.]
MALSILKAGPGITVQDQGRPGLRSLGLSRGGAMDPLALAEGAALLGQPETLAALEIAGSLVTLRAERAVRIALTGAPMRALCDGHVLAWNASHAIHAGSTLTISALNGGYGYVHAGGGIDTPPKLGSRAAHLSAGLGRMLKAGDRLPLGPDRGGATGLVLDPAPRFEGGIIRMVTSMQTGLFDPAELKRFQAIAFTRAPRANRMGQPLDGGKVAAAQGLSILSDAVVPGDIQITGDGTAFVLLAECQTTGGYPRIGTVLPCDLPRLVQAPPGAALRFRLVPLDEAVALEQAEAARRAGLRAGLRPLIRDPHAIADLLAYQLISGVTCGDDLQDGPETE